MNETGENQVTAHGYVISGDDRQGYRGRTRVPLTAQEVEYGVQDLIFSDSLADLLVLAHAELIKRSMVGHAEQESASLIAPSEPRRM